VVNQPRLRRAIRLGAFTLAVLGVLLAIGLVPRLLGLLEQNAFSDVRAYYDAGARLNAGGSLYPAGANVNASAFYRYPPLLAIAFRPLALLPYSVVAPAWAFAMMLALAGAIRRVGVRRPATWTAVGILAFPILWSLALGQAQLLVTLLLTIVSPWSVALAGQIKVLPALAAVYWVGRGDWRAFGRFLAITVALIAVQLILEPTGTIAYLGVLNLGQVGPIDNLSPYGISPLAWVIFAAALGGLALVAARTRHGWAAAVAFSVLATPRLLWYLLVALLAALRPVPPAFPAGGVTADPAPPEASVAATGAASEDR
jgi:hypothetical protein